MIWIECLIKVKSISSRARFNSDLIVNNLTILQADMPATFINDTNIFIYLCTNLLSSMCLKTYRICLLNDRTN